MSQQATILCQMSKHVYDALRVLIHRSEQCHTKHNTGGRLTTYEQTVRACRLEFGLSCSRTEKVLLLHSHRAGVLTQHRTKQLLPLSSGNSD